MLLTFALAAFVCAETPPALESIKKAITADAIRSDVAELSSDEMGGRFFRSPFAEKAAKWITAKFEGTGLTVARQPIDTNVESGPNLIAVLPAPKEGASAGYILVTAHYDHLRPKRNGADKIHNGADDNASGVAGMLAVARALEAAAKAGTPAKCAVVFVAFNGEEAGMIGSSAFVKAPSVPLNEVRAVFNMDMISRGKPREIYIDGGPVGASVIATLKMANEKIGLALRLDEHPDWLNRSDQGPFLKKQVPAVLFSVEEHEDYHQVTDEVSKIDASLAAEVAQLITLAVIESSAEPFTPREATAPAPPKAPATAPAP
ncbi:MAG: M20/M25/M40 family metallo-hydrolase [Planctomycetota bacterium]|nr:M20/M25/M40 family metallo-hydrolase [Planctomycetota bacterium]